jgi:hypothetical protein
MASRQASAARQASTAWLELLRNAESPFAMSAMAPGQENAELPLPAIDQKAVELTNCNAIAGETTCLFPDNDLGAILLIGAFKAAGNVYRVADHCIVETHLRADIADQHITFSGLRCLWARPERLRLARAARDRRASNSISPGQSGISAGAAQNAMTASPMNLSIVPP